MKLVFFDDYKLGLLKGDQVVDVSSVVQDIPHIGPHDLISGLIERFAQYKGRLEQAASSSQGVPVSQVQLRPPLPKPGQIVCMAVNYTDSGTREPAPINAFLKSPKAVIGPGDTIVLSKDQATVFEHEAELGFVIGKRASKVKADDWREYVFGYLNFIDVSSRGLGAPPMDSFFPTKSQHTSAPLGPWLVTADEIPDPMNLPVKLSVSGVLRQDYPTDGMVNNIAQCVEWCSMITTLEPGDVIATGTNHLGLGPLQDGDTVEMEIAGLGKLELKVKDDQKREWPRETRGERMAREAASS
ncbi:MAG: fumarylacetoacetate hydrolase family protein [Dehalococcoidia bacterium]